MTNRMLNALQLRAARPDDAERISAFVSRMSRVVLLSPDGAGAEKFFASINTEAEAGYIAADNYSYLIAENEHSALVGVAALRDNAHLFHLFVAEDLQRQGLGRMLWEGLRNASLAAGNPGRHTVNSSPNAVPFYQRCGFELAGPPVEADGIRFQPMLRLHVQS